ncbi:hypothetical protein BB558_003979 [Smittium angustum]|uniref:Uncharacterized protein n=1 Tax=Smittium angustum TaxID=133377 RepID=A0A2U1J4K3_SMIAN|nr:hypothetical protein BB558_003979 [Smittium angustum]
MVHGENHKSKNTDLFYHNESFRVDQGYGSVGISPYYRDVVLAGDSGLCIIDLENPYEPPFKVQVNSQWKVVNVEWCPHKCRDGYVASTLNQTVLVWNFATASKKPEISLSDNMGSATGFNWSSFDPNILITTSVDPYIRLWDLREPSKPVLKMTNWDVASSVEFSKSEEFVFVSGCQNSND